MSASIEYLNNKQGDIILPKTVTKAVYDENGNRLDRVLGQPNMDMVMLGWSVPIDCPIKNYVDDNRIFHQRVGRVILNGSENWTTSSGRYVVSCKSIGLPNAVNSAYSKKYNYGTSTKGSFRIATNVIVYDTDYDGSAVNLAAFKNKLASSPLAIYYELATEITTPVDGNEVLATKNTISDAYDPSKTYSEGQYCIYNNTLWKSKVDNNLGNTPVEGTYWTTTSVARNLITTNGEGKFGYLGADDSFVPFKSSEEPVLLWENPNKSVAFAGQTISMDLSKYSHLLVTAAVSKAYNSGKDYVVTSYIPIDGTYYTLHTSVSLTANAHNARNITAYSDRIVFGDAYATGTKNNDSCIPIAVYGVSTEFEVVTKNIAIQEWLTASITTAYTITKDYEYVTILSGNTVTFSGNIGETLVAKQQIIGNSSYYYYIFKDVKSGTKFTPASTSYGMQITAIPYV